jgi:predicted outer membrane repeat protein
LGTNKRRLKMKKVSLLLRLLVSMSLGCFFTVTAYAVTLEVGPLGYPYSLIQTAINGADTGDTVLVHDGTYMENINFSGKAITVKSVYGAASTIIDGNRSGIVVTFSSGEGSGSVLDGFTILNGFGSGDNWGGGIRCFSSSPTITNCIIRGNTGNAGAGISCESGSSPAITHCVISGNSALIGGGIYCKNSSPTITNCTINGNTGTWTSGGIGCDSGSSAIITNCVISGNTADDGGGIYSYTSSPTITNCTISRNTATQNGGGINCQSSSPSVKNTILWGNVPNEVYLTGSSITVTYSDVDQDGYAGSNGNIRQDPLFVDSTNENFYLQPNSPCIDAATSDGAPSTDMEDFLRYDDPLVANTGGGTYPYYDIGTYESQAGIVTLIAPNGAETIPAGSSYTIRWRSREAVKFRLWYSVDNGLTWIPILKAGDFLQDTTYDWQVPKPTANRKKCLVRVKGYDDQGKRVGVDKSDATFTIEVLTITDPISSDSCTPGQPCLIAWNRSPYMDAHTGKLSYSTNGGLTWKLISSTISESDTGYSLWEPTVGVTKKNCRVKLVYKNDKGVVGTATSGKFTINKP